MSEQLRYPLSNIGPQDDYFKIQIRKYEAPGLNLTGGFALGTSEQAFDTAVAAGKIKLVDGRMTTKEDKDVCVISKELAELNGLQVGDSL